MAIKAWMQPLWVGLLILSGAAIAQETPLTYRWTLSDASPRLANRFVITLEICDGRRFAWAPVSLPSHAGLLTRFEAEIAIEKTADGTPCVGTRWSWTVLPVRAGVIVLETMRLQASRFGQPLDYAIKGPRIQVSAPPPWLPTIIANRRPAIFSWVVDELRTGERTQIEARRKDFAQQTLRLQSSLSRDGVEKWLLLVLEDQPVWRGLPPLVEPVKGSLGDDFLVTFFAPMTPPEIPALRLQINMLNPQKMAIETLRLERPAEVVSDASRTQPVLSATVHPVVMAWSSVYLWGHQNLLWLAGLALLLIFLVTRYQAEGWRLWRLWLIYRLKNARAYATLWQCVKTSGWPVDSRPEMTPRTWAQLVAMEINDPEARLGLWVAATALDKGLFSPISNQDPHRVRESLISALEKWRPPKRPRPTAA